jgi:glycerophosphoryl diester phosphodiesterase
MSGDDGLIMGRRWKPGIVLGGMGEDLKRAWLSLALTDRAARVLTFAILGPAVAVLLRWFLQRGGSTGVVTDESILFFFLSPMGVITLVTVGAVAGAIYYAEVAALLTITLGAQNGLHVRPWGALRFVAGRAHVLLVLALRVLLRLLLVAAPFLAASGAVYAVLLTRYDIYYYLNVKPPPYWIAVVLITGFLALGAFFVVRRLLRWAFALPIVLFEGTRPGLAMKESAARTSSGLVSLAAWHAAWLAAGFGLTSLATVAVGVMGRELIPAEGALAVVAAAVGVVAVSSFVLNLTTIMLSNMVYSAMLGRLYTAVRPQATASALGTRLEAFAGSTLRVGARLAWAAALVLIVGISVITLVAINRARNEAAAEITAHRGAKHDAPENTLAAVALALDQGADWVEIDVQLTADGHVIVVHDRDFNRVSGSPLRAETSDLAELRALDVGRWFGADFAGESPPTLGEVLDLCQGRAGVNIELKYFGPDRGLAERVIEIVEDRAMGDQVLLMSFAHQAIAEAKKARPDWQMGVLVAVAVGNILRLEADFYAVPMSVATRRFIRAAHRRGREVHVWTVDDPLRMSALVSRGVDNLITGYPTVARDMLAERKAMGPVERLLINFAAEFGIVRLPPAPPATSEDA